MRSLKKLTNLSRKLFVQRSMSDREAYIMQSIGKGRVMELHPVQCFVQIYLWTNWMKLLVSLCSSYHKIYEPIDGMSLTIRTNSCCGWCKRNIILIITKALSMGTCFLYVFYNGLSFLQYTYHQKRSLIAYAYHCTYSKLACMFINIFRLHFINPHSSVQSH